MSVKRTTTETPRTYYNDQNSSTNRQASDNQNSTADDSNSSANSQNNCNNFWQMAVSESASDMIVGILSAPIVLVPVTAFLLTSNEPGRDTGSIGPAFATLRRAVGHQLQQLVSLLPAGHQHCLGRLDPREAAVSLMRTCWL